MASLTSLFHSIIQEIVSLKKWDHPQIIKILEIFKDKKKLYIVLEFVPGKTLLDHVIENYKLDESETCYILKQILKTIKYVHSKNIIHRDLKPENMMIDPKNSSIKLIDFGLSSFYNESQSLMTKVGTPYYVSPEVLLGNGYSKETDIWSVGVIGNLQTV